jgi:spermidine/putrescine transport system permease protein
MKTSVRQRWGSWLVGAPPSAYLLVFFAAPSLIMVVASLRVAGDYGGLMPLMGTDPASGITHWLVRGDNWREFFTLEGFGRFFADPIYLEVFARSFGYAALTTLACLALGYPLAWLIARSARRHRDPLILLVVLPFWSNFLIRVYAWMIVLGPQGAFAQAVNAVLGWLGVAPVQLLFNAFAVVVVLIYVHLPFMVLPLYANLEKHDPALLDAAQDLGAGKWQRFWRVTFPLSLPGVWAGAALVFIPALGIFAIPDILGGTSDALIGNVIKQQFLETRDWPFGSVLSIVLTIAALALAGFAAWIGRRNLGTPSSARTADA